MATGCSAIPKVAPSTPFRLQEDAKSLKGHARVTAPGDAIKFIGFRKFVGFQLKLRFLDLNESGDAIQQWP